MEEQKKWTIRNFIEENSKTVCGAGLILAGCVIGAAVGRELTQTQIACGLETMFSENSELKKLYVETSEKIWKKN